MLKQQDVVLEEKREYLVKTERDGKQIGKLEEVTPNIFKCFAYGKGKSQYQLSDATTRYQAVEIVLEWHNKSEKIS